MDTELQQLQKTDRNPVQETRYQELLKTGGGLSPTSNSYGSSSIEDAIAKATAAQKQATQPAIASLQASIPETQAKYEQSKQQLQASQQPLEQRYQNLLDSIKTQQTSDVTNQSRITTGELAKRGILPSSTLYDQEVTNATQPINAQYAGLSNQTGLAREDALRTLQDQITNITPQETADTRAIQNAIAQLQSGGAQTGISQGLGLYSTQLQQQLAQQKAAQDAQQQTIANQIAQAQLANQTKQTNYDIGKPYYNPDTNTALDPSIQALLNQIMGSYGGNTQTTPNTPKSFQPLSTSTTGSSYANTG